MNHALTHKKQRISNVTRTNASSNLGMVKQAASVRAIMKDAHQIRKQQSDLDQTPLSCPTFVSLTVNTQAPSVSACRDRCRIGMGCCTTPRGDCGATDTGAVMKGKIRVPEGCTGELALMQNLTSTDRRRVLNGGNRECIRSTDAIQDGAIPWKGCVVPVIASGEHEIISEDCPNIRLRENMRSTSVSDSFKTFLLWKATGTSSRRSIANVSWAWSATATRSSQGQDGCTDQWRLSNPTNTDGDGTASRERPAHGSPTAQNLRWGGCGINEERNK